LAHPSRQFKAKFERLTSQVGLPTTMVAGQVTLAGLLCAAVIGAGRLTGHW